MVNGFYISSITDEASRGVLAAIVSASPNKAMIQVSLNELERHIKDGIKPVLRSSQSWQYQMTDYQQRLKDMNISSQGKLSRITHLLKAFSVS